MTALDDLRGYPARADALRDEISARWNLSLARPRSARDAAVLMLFGPASGQEGRQAGELAPEHLDLLLLQRATTLGSHAGEVAFPGGKIDPGDADERSAALREAVEETGLDPSGVRIMGTLPQHPLPYTNFLVTPVLSWWETPSPVYVVDTRESERVFRIPVTDLLDPAHRVTASLRRGGVEFNSPAFQVGDVFIWGFTGKLIDETFHFLGWERPWDPERKHHFDL